MKITILNTSPQSSDHLWLKWFEKKDETIANELIKCYLPLVRYHVDRIALTTPSNIERSDLFSLGLIGLYDALNRFDIKRELKFDTYASFRIRGSIIDGLRKEDWLSRTSRDKVKKVELASEMLEQTLKRTPTAEEIAQETKLNAGEVVEVVRDSLFANVLSIDKPMQSDNQETVETIGNLLPDKAFHTPEESLVKEELVTELVTSLKELNENEQLVISLFYVEELSMTEIGEVLELTTSRISQIHKQALFKLRKILQKSQVV